MNQSTLDTAPPHLASSDAVAIVKEHFGLDGQLKSLDSERDQNFHLRTVDGQQFVLKIANPAENPDVVDLQVKALRHLAVVDPALPLPRVRPDSKGSDIVSVAAADATYLVRLVSFLDGEAVGNSGIASAALLKEQGSLLARLDLALRGFFHPAAQHELLWDMKNALCLTELLDHVSGRHQRQRVTQVLENFHTNALPVLPALRAQVIHNDLNPDNFLVDRARPDRITGIIDFGDIVHSPLIVDLAVTAAYQLTDSATPLKPLADLISAYHRVLPLEDGELAILFDLIAMRVATSVVISSWRATKYPENRDYILTSNPLAVRLLDRLAQISRTEAADYFRNVCALPVKAIKNTESDHQLITRRNRSLGPAYRLFYDRPLHFVRGEGVWLYDPAGRAFLDCYNNVACVGHCHPRVVNAIARQTAQLNTHTRYLHPGIVDYAERLAGLFPFDDPVCLFCCSGSEANELAYRIAQAHTGGTGVVVTAHAYHGNSSTVAQFSTADTPPGRRGDFVQTVSAPDSYRGTHERGSSGLAESYASEVATAIQALQENDISPAALLVDTIFSCDGIVTPPSGYLARAAAMMRAAGGLLIADEVQAGFGRTGEHLWGFESHGVIPDIVTLGKPIGNGYPLAAVICPRRIVEAFAGQIDYFNTFGGNPVACAAGMAVLDVIEDEALQQNALAVGSCLSGELAKLQSRYALIGDVRGAGLFIGVELVADPKTLKPAAAQASAIVNALREHGILIGATGPHGNVLKIRPPLVFSQSNAEHLIDTLQTVIRSGK